MYAPRTFAGCLEILPRRCSPGARTLSRDLSADGAALGGGSDWFRDDDRHRIGHRETSTVPMSPASLGRDATIVVFVLTYAGVALGRAPGLRIDRAGMALAGASLMVDLDAIALLLGMMIIVSQLRVSGFFELAARFALRRAHSAPVLLAAIVIVTGLFSAFLVNDAICLVMAPLVIDVPRALRRNPVPYLLAVAMASNAGSAT